MSVQELSAQVDQPYLHREEKSLYPFLDIKTEEHRVTFKQNPIAWRLLADTCKRVCHLTNSRGDCTNLKQFMWQTDHMGSFLCHHVSRVAFVSEYFSSVYCVTQENQKTSVFG